MYKKQTLRIEDLDQVALDKSSDKNLAVLRLKFMQLWNKHFDKCEDVIVGSLNRNDLITKYRMLLKVMKGRSMEHSTESIDRQAFKRAMEVRKSGIDVAMFEPIIVNPNAVFIKADFSADGEDDIEVIIQSSVDEPNVALEKAVTKMLGDQLDKPCTFVYTEEFTGSCIPLFDEVLRPVLKIQKIEMENEDDGKDDKIFEKNLSIIPVDKASDQQIVMGIVYQPGSPDDTDSQGDWTDAKEIQKVAFQFMEDRIGLKIMHKGKNIRANILESYIAPIDFEVEGKSVKKGSWIMTARILDKKIFAKIKKGKYTGFSMAGWAQTA